MRRRSYHRLLLSLLIVFGILSVLLALAQDQHTIKVGSAYGAEDPKFASYVAALVNAEPTGGNRYQVLTNGDEIFPPMIAAIATAKRRIAFEILVEGDLTDAEPVKYASRYAYERLLRRGIEVYEYQPTMMHAKALIVDGAWSMVGSANFDNRSLELNDELNVASATATSRAGCSTTSTPI